MTTANFRLAFFRCTCVMIMLFNQRIDMSHLSDGWIILANEKYAFCAYGTFMGSFTSGSPQMQVAYKIHLLTNWNVIAV